MKKRITLSNYCTALATDSKNIDSNVAEHHERAQKQLEDAGLKHLLTGSRGAFPVEVGSASRSIVPGTGMLGEDVGPMIKIEDYTPVLGELGVTPVLGTGAVGKVSLPANLTPYAVSENEEVTETDTTITEVDVSPKRVSIAQPVSKLLILQGGPFFELFLNTLIAALYNKVLSIVFGIGEGSLIAMQGFGYKCSVGVNAQEDASTPTLYRLEEMEYELIAAGTLAGKLAFLTNGNGRRALRSSPVYSGHPEMLYSHQNTVLGYPCVVSNAVSRIAGGPNITGELLILGAWQDLVFIQHGPILVTIDPFTKARDNKSIIEITGFFDAKSNRGAKATSDNEETQSDNYAYSFASRAIRPIYGIQD